jgi:hypothetical protein
MVLSTVSTDMVSLANMAASAAISSAWGTNNKAVLVPVTIASTHTYVKAAWLNGATATGNVDVGIYTISGTTATRIVASTAEAQTGTSVCQVAAAFTTTTLEPGLYYLAMSCSSTSATCWRLSGVAAGAWRPGGVYQMTTAHPLPSSGTVATYTNTFLPIFGFSEVSAI